MAAYSDASRNVTIRGTITYPDAATQAITATHIVRVSTVGDMGQDIPIGAAPAVALTLVLDNSSGQWNPGGSILGSHTLDGATIELEVGLFGTVYTYTKIGTFTLEEPYAPEKGTTIQVKGMDTMAHAMSAPYVDEASDYPRTLSAILVDLAAQAGVTLYSSTFTNSTASVPIQPVWRSGVTCRDVAGYVAACAGGIAVMTRDNKLRIVTLAAATRSIGTSVYKVLERENTYFGPLNAINLYKYGSDDGMTYKRFATVPGTPDSSYNSLNIKDNPILAYIEGDETLIDAVGNGMLAALTGKMFVGASFFWNGDPAMDLGELCTLTDLNATANPILITHRVLDFKLGLSMESGGSITTSARTASSTKLQKIFTPTGNLNAEALAGNIYVRAGEKMKLESGGLLELLAGSSIRIAIDDTTGITLSTESAAIFGPKLEFLSDDILLGDRDNEQVAVQIANGEIHIGANLLEADRIVGDVVNTFSDSSHPWAGTFEATFANLPKYLTQDVGITVPAGTYNEDVLIIGYKGAKLTLAFSAGVVLNGNFIISGCDQVRIYSTNLGNFSISKNIDYLSYVLYSNVEFYRIVFSGGASTTRGIIADFSRVSLYQCEFNGCSSYCAQFRYVSHGYTYNNTGGGAGRTNAGYSVRVELGGDAIVVGTVPTATGGRTSVGATGGRIYEISASSSNGTQTAPTLPDAEIKASTGAYRMYTRDKRTGYKYLDSGAYTWTTSWTQDAAFSWASSTPRQGTYEYAIQVSGEVGSSGYAYTTQYRDLYRSMWIFPSLQKTGKVIQTAKIKLKRAPNFGQPSAMTVNLCSHTRTSAPTGTSFSELTDTGLTISLLPGQSGVIDLVSLLTGLRDTSASGIKGFGLLHSGNALACDISATIELTYA